MTRSDYILVVDDDPGCRQFLTELFRRAGLDARTAHDGADALSQLRDAPTLPALILLDFNMPVMDGETFRTHQAEDERLRDIPVVIVSAQHDLKGDRTRSACSAWRNR